MQGCGLHARTQRPDRPISWRMIVEANARRDSDKGYESAYRNSLVTSAVNNMLALALIHRTITIEKSVHLLQVMSPLTFERCAIWYSPPQLIPLTLLHGTLPSTSL